MKKRDLAASLAWIGFAVLTSGVLLSCAPKIYLKDRHTVMEEEAAGEWPDFEKEILNASVEKSPTAFRKTDLTPKKKRLYQVLNGELVSPEHRTP